MKVKKEFTYYSADFETTVFEGQTRTDVWAAAIVELYTEQTVIFNNINDFMYYIFNLKAKNPVIYFHNLAFDGCFIMTYLLEHNFKQGFQVTQESPKQVEWKKWSECKNETIQYSISAQGKWFRIQVKINDHVIEFRDSFKLLPLSVQNIGKSFKTKHQKTSIVYEGFRKPYGLITDQEKEYIANDVLVVKEALEIMISEGHEGLTIGSCCLKEFQDITSMRVFRELFPDLTKYQIDADLYGAENADEYIRKSYRGGWCYVNPALGYKELSNGLTADVNSLYPSVMHSDSGNEYCVGLPKFWKGDFIPKVCKHPHCYYFVRIKTRFIINKGYLPFIQIKHDANYKSNDYLTTSDMYDVSTGKYFHRYIDADGNKQEVKPVLTLTKTDFELMKEHYELVDCEILDGCYFATELGIFDRYINKYREIKMREKDGRKQIAKLYLNNLYGKTAANDDSSFKIVSLVNGILHYELISAHTKKPGYIAIGSQITSYAKNFTIKAAQANYFGLNSSIGFAYADTDSIHVTGIPLDNLKNVPVHESQFNHWKIETFWDKAIFLRQKTYVEHVTHVDLKELEKPYYLVKCAGMGKRSQFLVGAKLEGKTEVPDMDEEEREFLSDGPMSLYEFNHGLTVPSDLSPKRVKGGLLLVKGDFTIL